MKKVFLMLVMMFTMSVSMFAEDNNTTEIAKYEINVNTDRLADYLELSIDQVDAVENVTEEFSKDLMFAAVECNDKNRKAVTKNAIEKNIKNMRYVLTEEQMKKYLAVLNVTISNRGILAY
jgi:Fe2+ transport system protein B